MCLAEVLLVIFGFVAILVTLINGRLPLSATTEMRGWQPYVMGVLLMVPFPLTVLVTLITKVGAMPDEDDILIELLILVPFVVAAVLVGFLGAKKRRRAKPVRRRTRPEYDDDADHRPRRRDRYEDADDEDRDRPRRRRRDDDDY